MQVAHSLISNILEKNQPTIGPIQVERIIFYVDDMQPVAVHQFR